VVANIYIIINWTTMFRKMSDAFISFEPR